MEMSPELAVGATFKKYRTGVPDKYNGPGARTSIARGQKFLPHTKPVFNNP